jgi:hypothetical protein
MAVQLKKAAAISSAREAAQQAQRQEFGKAERDTYGAKR